VAQEERSADKLLNNQSSAQNFYCNLEIAGSAIPPRNISYLALREWVLPTSLVPRLELSVFDDGLLSELKTPYYNQKIYLELGRSEEDDSPIEMIFDIYDYSIDKVGDSAQNLINITALISMNDPFVNPSKPVIYDQQSSDQVIETIGDRMFGTIHSGYKFKKGNISASDTMTRIQSYESDMDFLKSVLQWSYVGSGDSALAFVNNKAELHYAPLINSFIQEPVFTARYDVQLAVSQSKAEMKHLAVKKGYTEEQALNDIWYSSINFRDYSGTIRTQWGFASKSTFFRRDKSTYTSNIFSLNINNTDADIYSPYLSKNTFYWYSGTVGINESENNQNAYVIKQNLITQLFSQSVLIEINSYADVNLMDTIYLNVNADIKTSNDFPINEKLSGTYLVGGITHTVGGTGSLYKKILTLFRTGVNKAGFAGVEQE